MEPTYAMLLSPGTSDFSEVTEPLVHRQEQLSILLQLEETAFGMKTDRTYATTPNISIVLDPSQVK